MGAEMTHGGDGQDQLYGDAYEMSGAAWGQNDRLVGGSGNDSLFGDAFEAGIGRPALDVRGGDDVLVGGPGNDVLWGDFAFVEGEVTGGRDVFVLGPNSGYDLIGDFESGKDRIDVSGYEIDGFDQLDIFDNGTTAVTVWFDDRSDVLVQTIGQDPLVLKPADFIFG